ncbi:MAG: MMPL family transporter [Pseudomonadota bacterium]
MKGLGFGLERIGIVALTHPRLFLLLIVLATALCGSFIPTVKFNGSVTSVVPRTSETFIAYEQNKRDFRNFSRDVAIVVRSDRLDTADGLEDLRALQLDMSLAEGVTSALSVFALPSVDKETGEIGTFFPGVIETDEEANALVERLINEYPQASNLISRETKSALLLVALDVGTDGNNDALAVAAYKAMVTEAEELAPQDFELLYAGLTPIRITILDTLVKDQVRLTLIGLVIGAVVAMVFFRCLASAVLCAVPPTLTAVWSIGFFGIVGIPITYLTTILPTLALILAYADGIVLHHRWQQLNRTNASAKVKNLREAVLRVGPASALTSLTTAIAISSFALSSSEALTEFAWVGMALVLFAFLSVIIALPIVGLWICKFDLLREVSGSGYGTRFGILASRASQRKPMMITVLSVVLLPPLLYLQSLLVPNYQITDYLPRSSDTFKAEQVANETFGGRSLVFFSVPVVEEGGLSSANNRKRLAEVSELLASDYGEAKVFSLHAVWRNFSEEATVKIVQQLENASEEVQQGYLSKDGKKLLISIRIPSSQSISENSKLLAKLEQSLSKLEYADEIVITGFPALLAKEFTAIIGELKTSLMLAVVIGIGLIGLATRSVFYAAAVAVPNVFPILLVEMFFYFNGGEINVIQVVALTLAFGISIDNAVHVVNIFEAERGSGKGFATSLQNAMLEVAPALGGSTLIICTATLTALSSTLPILPIIGQLIIAILVIALITNLIILPANLLTLGRIFRRNKAD